MAWMANVRQRMLDADAVATQLGELGRMCVVEPNMPYFQFSESAQLM
jgi:hypothetical protein